MGLKLTDREKEIALHLSEDNTVTEVGGILGISWRTVQAHVRYMRARFNKRTVAGLIAELFRQKLIE